MQGVNSFLQTFINEHEDLCQVEGSKVPAVQVEEDLQRSGGKLKKMKSRTTEKHSKNSLIHSSCDAAALHQLHVKDTIGWLPADEKKESC